MVKRSWRKSPS